METKSVDDETVLPNDQLVNSGIIIKFVYKLMIVVIIM